MTYTREITNLIVYYWGKGLTAEETVQVIEEKKQVRIGLATVYRHRHSLTTDQIIEVLFTDQRRDIALATDIALRLKYRDKLLNKFIPQRIEAFQKTLLESKQEVTFRFDGLSPEEREFAKSIARKYIKANNQTEPASIH